MKIRSRTPLRIGLAGGGTDLTSYSAQFGGAVFNATINLYAHCTLTPLTNNKIVFHAPDLQHTLEFDSTPKLVVDEPLILHKGIYNRIVRDFNGGKPLSLKVTTNSDVPMGSGLGGSSTMVVTILECYNKWLNLNLNDYQLARLAYEIERFDIKLTGGKQDTYSAVFGGFNLMEFNTDDSVTINTLRLNENFVKEFSSSLLLYYSGHSRSAAEILDKQIASTSGVKRKISSVEAMHFMKQNAYDMKNAFLKSDIKAFVELLRQGWEKKKQAASVITNPEIEEIIDFALKHGAKSVKVSGAGGGGFMMIVCDPEDMQHLSRQLKTLNGVVYSIDFTKTGVESWISENDMPKVACDLPALSRACFNDGIKRLNSEFITLSSHYKLKGKRAR